MTKQDNTTPLNPGQPPAKTAALDPKYDILDEGLEDEEMEENELPGTSGSKAQTKLDKQVLDDDVTESNDRILSKSQQKAVEHKSAVQLVQFQEKLASWESKLLSDDYSEVEKADKMIPIIQKQIDKLTGKGTNVSNGSNDTIKGSQPVNKIKAIPSNEMPFFQLEDDLPEEKTDNKHSYKDADAFIGSFESTIKDVYEMDINKVWKKYISNAFMKSKNNNYRRWYNIHIKDVENDDVKWSTIKDMIKHRFNENTEMTNIDRYLFIKQKTNESLRVYVDRFMEYGQTLPEAAKNGSEMFHAAKFINSLTNEYRDVVKLSLKNNKKDGEENYYPRSMSVLYNYIQKNMGDLQESLHLMKKSSNSSNGKGFKRDSKDDETTEAKKSKYDTTDKGKKTGQGSTCTYCNNAPYSPDHLKGCIVYLQSDAYKNRIIKQEKNEKYKNNNNPKYGNKKWEKKVPTLFLQINNVHETNSVNNYSKTLDEIEEDMNDVFEEIGDKLNFDSKKYHQKFNPILNKKMILNHNSDEKILCYSVKIDELRSEDLSPYSPLITINNENLVTFMDTGATISLINKAYDFADKSIFDNFTPTYGKLTFADKDSFKERIGQTKPLEVSYMGKPTFSHCFEIVELPQSDIPILVGRDLIPKLNITFNGIAYSFDQKEEIIYDDTVDHMYVPNVSKACSEEEYEAFMKRMEPTLEANKNVNIHELCPLKEARVYLKTKPNEVAFTRQYPVAYALQPVVREQIQKWANDKTIEPAQPSAFNSPLTLVPKPNGADGSKKWRVCLDTRRINNLLEDVSNINTPLIDDIFHSVRESKIYSVFDISGAFHRLEINKADRHKLTFTFEGKSYQFRGACFGLKSLSGIFQNVMETIFADMKEFTCIYIDDLLCHSKDMESHEIHCKKIIDALTKFKLPLNQEKTHLARNSVYLLGFCISEQGKSIDPRRLANIDDWEKPMTSKAMMKFCGWVSYMRAHLPKASELTAPLDHLRYSTKKVLEWTPQMHEHYDSIIKIIKTNIVLSHPDLSHEFSLSVDASQYSIGACLFQEYKNNETGTKTIKYIGFMSKALAQSQRSYCVTKKELYALTFGLNKFYKFLHGDRPFKCYTDHRSLQYLFTSKQISMMLMRYMEIILSFPNMQVIWIPGKDNVMSDKLSRLFPQEQDRIVFEKEDKALFPEVFKTNNQKSNKSKRRLLKLKLSKKKVKDNQLPDKKEFSDNNHINTERISNFSQYFVEVKNNDYGLPKAEHYVRMNSWSIKTIHDKLIEDETINPDLVEDFQINYVQNMDEEYIIPPESERADILKCAHEFGHYGGEAIVKRIRTDEGMNWPNIIKDALEIVKQCATCQKFVISKRGYNPLKPLYCYTPGFHYQMDLCGPFPVTTYGSTYILVLLDVATRFVVLRAIPDKSARTVAKELVSIFSLIGYPRILNSDRGTEWRNQILDLICEAMKIDKRLSTAYYAQGNGGAERAVQNTKKLLSKLILGISEDNWDVIINSVQLMINCKISKRLQTSPFNLMFARKMTNGLPLLADPKDDLEPMDNDELLKRIEYMSDIVFPAIKERTDVYNQMMKNQFDKRHRLVDYPVGSFVVVRKKGIQKSLSPVYEGPYEVVRKTDRGNYTLRDELGLLLPREHTPSELKLVSQDAVVSKEEVYEFDAIVDHRGDDNNREYKIRWKNYSPADDSWITADMFTDPQAINNYWKRIKGVVPNKDKTNVSNKPNTDKDSLSFDKSRKGKMLDQVYNISESIHHKNDTVQSAPKDKTIRKRGYTRTSTHTKPIVTSSPALKSFRRSSRLTKKPSFKPAMDQTRYKK